MKEVLLIFYWQGGAIKWPGPHRTESVVVVVGAENRAAPRLMETTHGWCKLIPHFAHQVCMQFVPFFTCLFSSSTAYIYFNRWIDRVLNIRLGEKLISRAALEGMQTVGCRFGKQNRVPWPSTRNYSWFTWLVFCSKWWVAGKVASFTFLYPVQLPKWLKPVSNPLQHMSPVVKTGAALQKGEGLVNSWKSQKLRDSAVSERPWSPGASRVGLVQ